MFAFFWPYPAVISNGRTCAHSVVKSVDHGTSKLLITHSIHQICAAEYILPARFWPLSYHRPLINITIALNIPFSLDNVTL